MWWTLLSYDVRTVLLLDGPMLKGEEKIKPDCVLPRFPYPPPSWHFPLYSETKRGYSPHSHSSKDGEISGLPLEMARKMVLWLLSFLLETCSSQHLPSSSQTKNVWVVHKNVLGHVPIGNLILMCYCWKVTSPGFSELWADGLRNSTGPSGLGAMGIRMVLERPLPWQIILYQGLFSPPAFASLVATKDWFPHNRQEEAWHLWLHTVSFSPAALAWVIRLCLPLHVGMLITEGILLMV